MRACANTRRGQSNAFTPTTTHGGRIKDHEDGINPDVTCAIACAVPAIAFRVADAAMARAFSDEHAQDRRITAACSTEALSQP